MWILALHEGQKGNFAQYFNQWPTYQQIFINIFTLRFVDEKSEIKIEKTPYGSTENRKCEKSADSKSFKFSSTTRGKFSIVDVLFHTLIDH